MLINLTFRDVLIYNVPVHQRGVPDNLSLKGSGFVFEVDGLCIFHSGDVSEPFNEDQLQLIGHVDVLLQVIGGVYTIGPDGGRKVIEQLRPKIVIPMHYWYQQGVLERFLDGSYRARSLDTNTLTVSKDTLPPSRKSSSSKCERRGTYRSVLQGRESASRESVGAGSPRPYNPLRLADFRDF